MDYTTRISNFITKLWNYPQGPAMADNEVKTEIKPETRITNTETLSVSTTKPIGRDYVHLFDSHYVENMLMFLFFAALGVAMYASHVHNDAFCAWSQSIAGNILSALFAFCIKKPGSLT